MKIILAGAGAVGAHLAKMLSNENHDITVIDTDPDRLKTCRLNSGCSHPGRQRNFHRPFKGGEN